MRHGECGRKERFFKQRQQGRLTAERFLIIGGVIGAVTISAALVTISGL
jgi:NhaP-type Na+/H+ or K+/H+ antiporter